MLDPMVDRTMHRPSPPTSVVRFSQYSFYFHICPVNDVAY